MNLMSTTQFIADYTAALNLASFDASRGDRRWLGELLAMAPGYKKRFPEHRATITAAVRKAKPLA
jgi:hypothetical protein